MLILSSDKPSYRYLEETTTTYPVSLDYTNQLILDVYISIKSNICFFVELWIREEGELSGFLESYR